MTKKIAINGLGRIGRLAAREIISGKYPNLVLSHLNSPGPIETLLHLLKYDSIHGFFPLEFQLEKNYLIIGNQKIRITHEKELKNISWLESGAELILECSGKFTDGEKLQTHLDRGAKKVLISSPCKNIEETIIYGVNHHQLSEKLKVISAGSCTTNALAPLAKIFHDNLKIEYGFMTTIHAYTNDQNIIDSSHKDLRRARAAALSMIPTSTGAAESVGLVIPELWGKISGSAIRVPVPNVSLVDFKFVSEKTASNEEINELIKEASVNQYHKIISVASAPLVSSDFNHTSYSAILDPYETRNIGKMTRVLAWYDNELGFTSRMLDLATIW